MKNSGIIDKSAKLKHYQLVGSINKRISVNFSKVINFLNDLSVNFAPSECVFNILSKAVLSSEASADILDLVEIGKNVYEQFVDNRIKGSTPLWEKMKKRNLKIFQAQSKVVRCKLNDKIVKIKEESSLITRFLIMQVTERKLILNAL